MITPDLIKKTINYVKVKSYGEPTGHDWYHIERVWKMAKYLQKKEGGDPELIEIVALLHDFGDYKSFEFDQVRSALAIDGVMDILDIREELQKKILRVIIEARYAGEKTKTPATLEGKIVQDADWLDAVGAIGVARTFATGGYIKRMLYDPKRKVRRNLKWDDFLYRKSDGTSLNYFYEKSLKLPAMMNTKTAKEIAGHRVKCMENFIKEFLTEWEGKK